MTEHCFNVRDVGFISPPGYSFFHEPCADQRTGGGVGILVSDQLKTDIHPLP